MRKETPEERRHRIKVWRVLTDAPSMSFRYKRKSKLKMRYKDKLEQEIERTEEKLELLKEIQSELGGGISDVEDRSGS